MELSTTYFSLISRQQQIENRRRQLDSLERLAERFTALADAGRQPQFAAERAQARVLFIRTALLNAEDAYVGQLDRLKQTLGLPIERPVTIRPVRVVVPEPELDPVRAAQAALLARLDLQNNRDLVEDARRQVRVARNRMLPDLNLFADVDISTDPEAEFGGAGFDLGSSDFRAGGTLDLPLDRKPEAILVKRSLINLEREARTYRLARDRVVLEVRETIRDIIQAQFTLELQERNIRVAQRRRINVLLRQRELGPREVIEAEEDLLEARNRRDLAEAELQQSILRFLLATGQMRVAPDGTWLAPGSLMEGADVGNVGVEPDGVGGLPEVDAEMELPGELPSAPAE